MREKLIEILGQADDCNAKFCENCEFIDKVEGCVRRQKEILADVLTANDVTIQKWIPVSEKLPEPMEWVLCACRANIIEVLRYDHIMNDWDTTMPNRCYMKGFVTHWMPLPEPPKEE